MGGYPVALINAPSADVREVAFVQPDHLGSPRVVIDPIRDVATWEWSIKSEVFGDQAPNADPDNDGVAFKLALRFPGQQATDASGMFYNYQRDYDPAVGRYAQSDPIGLGGGISTYTYVSGSPTTLADSLGLMANCTCGEGGVSIDIPIRFGGDAATADVVNKMVEAIESAWSSPGFRVTVSQPVKGRANVIDVVSGAGVSTVKGHGSGIWYADMHPWTAAHEAGHLMKFRCDGRFDIYDISSSAPRKTSPLPGWEGNIMAEYPGVPDDRVRDSIRRALKCR